MADVTLTYKGATIAELDESGSKTLRTAGKFCEADIGVAYEKPAGSASVVSGTLTLAADTVGKELPDIDVGFDFSHFLVYTEVPWTGYGGRTNGGFHYWVDNGTTYMNGFTTNTAGSSTIASGVTTVSGNDAKINVVGQKVGTKFVFSGDSSWNGYYRSAITYFWTAW